MDSPVCPHCSKPIDLMGAKELSEEFGLGPNSVIHARKRGDFPDPFLSFGNRKLYLRSEVEAWVTEHRPMKPAPPAILAKQLAALLETMPTEERQELQKLIGAK